MRIYPYCALILTVLVLRPVSVAFASHHTKTSTKPSDKTYIPPLKLKPTLKPTGMKTSTPQTIPAGAKSSFQPTTSTKTTVYKSPVTKQVSSQIAPQQDEPVEEIPVEAHVSSLPIPSQEKKNPYQRLFTQEAIDTSRLQRNNSINKVIKAAPVSLDSDPAAWGKKLKLNFESMQEDDFVKTVSENPYTHQGHLSLRLPTSSETKTLRDSRLSLVGTPLNLNSEKNFGYTQRQLSIEAGLPELGSLPTLHLEDSMTLFRRTDHLQGRSPRPSQEEIEISSLESLKASSLPLSSKSKLMPESGERHGQSPRLGKNSPSLNSQKSLSLPENRIITPRDNPSAIFNVTPNQFSSRGDHSLEQNPSQSSTGSHSEIIMPGETHEAFSLDLPTFEHNNLGSLSTRRGRTTTRSELQFPVNSAGDQALQTGDVNKDYENKIEELIRKYQEELKKSKLTPEQFPWKEFLVEEYKRTKLKELKTFGLGPGFDKVIPKRDLLKQRAIEPISEMRGKGIEFKPNFEDNTPLKQILANLGRCLEGQNNVEIINRILKIEDDILDIRKFQANRSKRFLRVQMTKDQIKPYRQSTQGWHEDIIDTDHLITKKTLNKIPNLLKNARSYTLENAHNFLENEKASTKSKASFEDIPSKEELIEAYIGIVEKNGRFKRGRFNNIQSHVDSAGSFFTHLEDMMKSRTSLLEILDKRLENAPQELKELELRQQEVKNDMKKIHENIQQLKDKTKNLENKLKNLKAKTPFREEITLYFDDKTADFREDIDPRILEIQQTLFFDKKLLKLYRTDLEGKSALSYSLNTQVQDFMARHERIENARKKLAASKRIPNERDKPQEYQELMDVVRGGPLKGPNRVVPLEGPNPLAQLNPELEVDAEDLNMAKKHKDKWRFELNELSYPTLQLNLYKAITSGFRSEKQKLEQADKEKQLAQEEKRQKLLLQKSALNSNSTPKTAKIKGTKKLK